MNVVASELIQNIQSLPRRKCAVGIKPEFNLRCIPSRTHIREQFEFAVKVYSPNLNLHASEAEIKFLLKPLHH